MAAKPHLLRKTFLVDRAFQLKYFLIFSSLGGGLTTFWGILILRVFHEDRIRLGLASVGSGLFDGAGDLFWWCAGILVLLTWFIGMVGLVITHRIAGPAFVMGRAMNELTAGKYPHLRPLRKSDDLNTLYASLGAMVQSLLKTDRDELSAIEKTLELISKAESGSPNEATTLLRELHAKKLARVGTAAADVPKNVR